MTREIEIACAGFGDLRLDNDREELTYLNCLSSIWHLSDCHDGSTRTGKSVCRWSYNPHNSSLVKDEPFASTDYSFCNRCLPRLAMEAGRRTKSTCVESSSSSSS